MKLHPRDTGKDSSKVHWNGVVNMQSDDLRALLSGGHIAPKIGNKFDLVMREVKRGFGKAPEVDMIDGWFYEARPCDGQIILRPKPNLVVAIGVQQAGDRNFGLSGPPAVVQRIGVDNGTTNPTATSVSSDVGGGTDTGSSTQTLRTFDSAATRSASVISATGTFNDATTGGIGAVSYAMRRLFLSRNAANVTNTTSADAANSLYSMTNVFNVDFTTLPGTWQAIFTATVTLAGT